MLSYFAKHLGLCFEPEPAAHIFILSVPITEEGSY
jgi:hypothetical protein